MHHRCVHVKDPTAESVTLPWHIDAGIPTLLWIICRLGSTAQWLQGFPRTADLNTPCKKFPTGQYTVSLASNKWGKDYPQQPTSVKKTICSSQKVGKRLSSASNQWGKRLPVSANNKRGQKHNHHQQSNTSHEIPHTDFPIQAHSPFQFHALQSNTVAVAARTTCSLSLGRNLGLSSAQLHLSGACLAAKCQGNMFNG